MTAVHPGVNWQQLTAIICTMLGLAGGFTAWVIRRVEASRSRTEQFVTERVAQVATMLSDRLGAVDRHLTEQDNHLGQVRDRVSRIEGKLSHD